MASSKTKLASELKSEVEKNIYLTMENKYFLLENFSVLPEKILKGLLKDLKKQNTTARKYIEKAIDENPGLVTEMKSKSRILKQKLTEIQEEEGKEAIERKLEKQLRKA